MANGCVVDTSHPIHVDQTAVCNGLLERGKVSDSQFKASTTTAKIEPIPEIIGLIVFIVPSGHGQSSVVTVNCKSLIFDGGVLSHGETRGRECGNWRIPPFAGRQTVLNVVTTSLSNGSRVVVP